MSAGVDTLLRDLKTYIGEEPDTTIDPFDSEDPRNASFSEEHVKENLSNYFEPIGSGRTRHVYKIKTDKYGSENKGRVIKFANDKDSRRYNKQERQTWMAFKGTPIGSEFCPIRNFDPNNIWLIMDYAEPRLDDKEANEIRDYIEDELDTVILDINGENIGVHPNRGTVLIDYPWGGKFNEVNL